MKNLLKWLEFAGKLAPMVLGTIPGFPPNLILPVASAINEAEQIPGASGADKKAHVLAAVGDIAPDVQPVVATAIDTTVGVINLVHANHALVPAAEPAAPATPPATS